MILTNIDPKLKFREIEKLLDLPQTVLVNKFDEDSAKAFRDAFNKAVNTGQKVIPIVIDSYGGQVYSLMSMIETLRAAPEGVKVATIGTGKQMSCGSLLLTCGDDGLRFMGQHSTCMIHEVASGSHGKVEEIKADAKETERLNQLLTKMLATNIGKPEDYFIKLIHERSHADWFLTSEECKSHGIVNHIRLPSFQVKVAADITFG